MLSPAAFHTEVVRKPLLFLNSSLRTHPPKSPLQDAQNVTYNSLQSKNFGL